MVQSGVDPDMALAVLQRQALREQERVTAAGVDVRAVALREDALVVCTVEGCGWILRGDPRAITKRATRRGQEHRVEQQRLWDTAYAHAVGMHGLGQEDLHARDCDAVRSDLGMREPDRAEGQAHYLRCDARLYAVGGSEEGVVTAYNEHWDRCPVTEALRREGRRAPGDPEVVYTRRDPLLPHWRYVP